MTDFAGALPDAALPFPYIAAPGPCGRRNFDATSGGDAGTIPFVPRPRATVGPSPGTAPVGVRAALRSDVGIVRERNEDAAHVDPDGRFVIVADGMGGHEAGDVASRMAVDAVRMCLEGASADLAAYAAAPSIAGRLELRALLERAVRLANDAILARAADPDKHGMGTTLDVAVVVGGEVFVAHVGDGRVYLVRDGVTTQVTTDHTIAEVMRQSGGLTDEEAVVSPMRSMLSNAVGIRPELPIDHASVHLRPGDRLLVCTDGLHDYFKANELAAGLSDRDASTGLDGLIDEARARGGHDNLTGVVVEAFALAGEPPAEELDDVPTTPVALVDPDAHGPLAAVSDDAIASIVEHVLRESSRPVARPRP